MKKIILTVLLLFALFTGVVCADDDTKTYSGQISVTKIQTDPQVLMNGDTATLKVEVTNSGNGGVGISRAKLYSNDFEIMGDSIYNSVGTLGPGNKMEFTFTIHTKSGEGIYYPRFYLDLNKEGSLNYEIPVRVDNSGLSVSLTDMPDSFSEGKKCTIKLTIGNPRENAANGVTVTPSGDCFDSVQTSVFIGQIESDQSATGTFEITPIHSGDLSFDIDYRNGMNHHTTNLAIPITLGEGKKDADLVINNIEVTHVGSEYKVNGDITNVGLEDAKSVQVTAGDTAEPSGSFPVYVVGTLQPDDFSSFEITFTANDGGSVPLLAKSKDGDGNLFTKTSYIDLGYAPAKMTENDPNNSAGSFPWIPIVLLLAVLGGLYAWKKGMLPELKKK